MGRDDTIGLLGSLGVLALVLLGLAWIVRGVLPGSRSGSGPPASSLGFAQSVLGRSLAGLLSFAVVYKFFFERSTAGVLSPEIAVSTAVVMLVGMALVPFAEVLVSVAALTIFLIDNTAVFGGAALGSFLVLLLFYVPLRWFLGR